MRQLFIFIFLHFPFSLFAQENDSLRFDKAIINKQLSILDKQGTRNKEQGTQNTKQQTVVFLFLDVECPICQKYALKIREIDSICQKNKIPFIGVFTDRNIKKKAIKLFKSKYNLKIETIIDKKLALAKALKASTTPEVFLIDRVGERVAYRGLIDDWFYRLGKSRKEPTAHYLLDAIDSLLKKEEISIKKTTPIGCLIQY